MGRRFHFDSHVRVRVRFRFRFRVHCCCCRCRRRVPVGSMLWARKVVKRMPRAPDAGRRTRAVWSRMVARKSVAVAGSRNSLWTPTLVCAARSPRFGLGSRGPPEARPLSGAPWRPGRGEHRWRPFVLAAAQEQPVGGRPRPRSGPGDHQSGDAASVNAPRGTKRQIAPAVCSIIPEETYHREEDVQPDGGALRNAWKPAGLGWRWW